MSTKDTLRQLTRLFSTSPSSATPVQQSFPGYALPHEVDELLNEHLRAFASAFPLTNAGGSGSGQSEGERERIRWREGLLEIWATAEPLPGAERELHNIGRVSAFLLLLHKLSADVGNDDDSALISRKDIGSVWWNAILRRTMLGTPKEAHAAALGAKPSQTRGRKTERDRKGKEPAPPSSADALPLYVSRQALAAATRMIVWGMEPSREQADKEEDWVSPFGLAILNEYEDRSLAKLKGLDEGYGIRNLEECLIEWAERAPKAFFIRISPYLEPNGPAVLPSVSLILSYLTRNSTKAYHALSTPLIANLIIVALTTTCSAIVNLASKCLAICVVTLPVIIGEHLFGIMAVYGRLVSWEMAPDVGDEGEKLPTASEDAQNFLDDYEEAPPDPVTLFTVLYGIYPRNFAAFIRDAPGYLREKGWKGATGDGTIDLVSGIVREKSGPILRMHTLNPALFQGEAALELTDTERWSRLEAADVMAACDRNVVLLTPGMAQDWRGVPIHADQAVYEAEVTSLKRAPAFQTLVEGTPLESTAPTPKPASPGPSAPVSRAASRVRSPTPTSQGSTPTSTRVSTPHMPATTHFANFQALQSAGALASPASMSPARRSGSRLRDPSHGDPHPWPPVFDPTVSSVGPSSMSRRSSGVGSAGTGIGLLSPELIPFGSTTAGTSIGRSASPLPPTLTTAQLSAHLLRLETELVLLHGEVNFQSYLKQLHLQHMGTLHREKVLESGAEAERQGLFRTVRTLRAQLRATQNALDQLRSEQSATKANWTAHINDLRDKLAGLREAKMKWEHDEKVLRAEVEDWKDRCEKKSRELETEGAAFLDLKNQNSLDAGKLARITEYEHRIQALTKTLAICDADLVKFVDQRKEMNLLVGEYKKSEYLREAVEAECRTLKESLRSMENELADVRRRVSSPPLPDSTLVAAPVASKDELALMRREMERLRARNAELEERLADVLDEEDEGAGPGRLPTELISGADSSKMAVVDATKDLKAKIATVKSIKPVGKDLAIVDPLPTDEEWLAMSPEQQAAYKQRYGIEDNSDDDESEVEWADHAPQTMREYQELVKECELRSAALRDLRRAGHRVGRLLGIEDDDEVLQYDEDDEDDVEEAEDGFEGNS
ncbi:hypothetical protein JCM10049v2_007962 [Rhodotorula toruloides]